ncbi:MAG: methyltransferase [Chloroflexi bacterium]|nr:methyltransferase [Chloroflexota bacterium]
MSKLRRLVEREIEAYTALQANVSGRVVQEEGLSIFCAPGVMSPTNRVTRCFAATLNGLSAAFVLDLGCGSGILALVAARCAREVVGVDIDPLAVACARCNADLNLTSNVRFLLGDGYAPVDGQMFDLIVSNPPFYAANGIASLPLPMCQAENSLLNSLIQGVRTHLNPGGKALFVTSSLSDNGRVKADLQANHLDYSQRLLHRGYGRSQDIYLWQAKASNW